MQQKFLLIIFLLLSFGPVFAQEDSTDYDDEPNYWVKPSNDEKSRMGIVMGIQTSSLFGTALPDNGVLVGLLGGAFGRYNFVKSGWSVQQEAHISFRGGNFKADAGEISSLKLLYLDFPFIIFKRFSKKSLHRFGAGIQYSTLINSYMYVDNGSYPLGSSPKLDKNDWSPLLSYQYQFPFFAIQGCVKYGLRDINVGQPWPESAKPFNNNGNINNFVITANLIF
jgi:hypothetical protein